MIHKIDHFWESVFGWFNYADAAYYKSVVDSFHGPAHFVEVGAFKGKSSSYMAVEIINSGKPIKFDCVDTWLGSPVHLQGGEHEEVEVVNGKLYEVFIENMKPVEGFYKAIRMPSVQAARLYKDETLDFVFIDADHEYDCIKADIIAWLPKIKKGGIIAGHDYAFDSVKKAVHELLTDVKVWERPPDWPCWHHTKL